MKTDRSRIVAYQNCPQLRWLTYHAYGTGLTPVAPRLELEIGLAVHEGLAKLALGADPDETIAAAGRGREPQWRWLVEGLLWAWWMERFPTWKRESEVVSVEQELLWPLAPDVEVMIRLDMVERRRESGGLVYREYKTTANGGPDWVKGWEHDTQVMLNSLALSETLREPVESVIIEGLVKGRVSEDRSSRSRYRGQRILQSPLCFGYRAKAPGGWLWSPDWSARAEKLSAWDAEIEPKAWVAGLPAETRQGLFVLVPDIRPRPGQLERWRTNAVAQERRIAKLVRRVERSMEPRAAALRLFPQYDQHCYRFWSHPCPYEACCFDPQVSEDPLESGRYVAREPHHTQEREEPLA